MHQNRKEKFSHMNLKLFQHSETSITQNLKWRIQFMFINLTPLDAFGLGCLAWLIAFIAFLWPSSKE